MYGHCSTIARACPLRPCLKKRSGTGKDLRPGRPAGHVVTGLLGIFRRTGARDAAEHDEVGHSVAAQAVGAMHAAGDLARREQTGDGLARLIEDFGGGVDLQAALVWWMPAVTLVA